MSAGIWKNRSTRRGLKARRIHPKIGSTRIIFGEGGGDGMRHGYVFLFYLVKRTGENLLKNTV